MMINEIMDKCFFIATASKRLGGSVGGAKDWILDEGVGFSVYCWKVPLGVISASIGPAVGLKVVEIKHHVLLVGQDGRALQI